MVKAHRDGCFGYYMTFVENYFERLVPLMRSKPFKVFFVPFADDNDLHVKQLRELGFTVKCGGRVKAKSIEDFTSMCDDAEPYDALMFCCPQRVGVVFSIMTVLAERGKPFVMLMNFDNLPIAPERYQFLKEHANEITMLFHPHNDCDGVPFGEDRITRAYCEYFFAFRMFDKPFIFLQPAPDWGQCRLL